MRAVSVLLVGILTCAFGVEAKKRGSSSRGNHSGGAGLKWEQSGEGVWQDSWKPARGSGRGWWSGGNCGSWPWWLVDEFYGINLYGNYVYNLGHIYIQDSGYDFVDPEIAGLGISVGQLCGVNPETGELITTADDLLPLCVRSVGVAGEVNAASFVGDGSGLTNLKAEELSGAVTVEQLPMATLSAAVLQQMPGGFADGVDNDTWLSDEDIAAMGYLKELDGGPLSEAEVDAMVADNGYALAADLNAIDASSITSGTLSTNVLPEAALKSSVGVRAGKGIKVRKKDDVTTVRIDKEYLYDSILSHIPPMSDLSMGSFTNSPASE